MKLTAILRAALLGSIAVLALPIDSPQDGILPAIRGSRLRNRLKTLFVDTTEETPPTASYNQNWAGAVLTGAGYRSITGTIKVPELQLPVDANSSVLHAVSAWVGIDGEYACPNAILQVGVDMYLNNSIPAYWAWFEWFPSRSTYLTDFSIRPDDSITMNITATSLSSATFSITNHRTGQTDSATLADQGPMICGFNAEWIVEDFWRSDGVPLPEFGRISFTKARFATDTGVTGGVEGAEIVGVKEEADGEMVIDCGEEGGDEVGCHYLGTDKP